MNTATLSSGVTMGTCHCSTPAGIPVRLRSLCAAATPASRDVVIWFADRIPRCLRTSLTIRAPLTSPFALRSSNESSGRQADISGPLPTKCRANCSWGSESDLTPGRSLVKRLRVEAACNGPRCDLRPGADPELVADPFDVTFGGPLGDEESLSDLLIRHA